MRLSNKGSPLSPPRTRRSTGNRIQRRPDLNSTNAFPALLDTFELVQSPDPTPYIELCLSSSYADIFEACLAPGNYAGMRTCLYNYQKNAVFKMLKRELLPDFFLDPLLTPHTIQSDQETKKYTHPLLPYYQFAHKFDQSTNNWLYYRNNTPNVDIPAQDVSWYSDVRGGIICEDMGTGKTCECLALTLLTKRQMTRPPAEGDVLPCVGVVSSPLVTDLDQTIHKQTSDAILVESAVSCRIPKLKHLAAKKALLSCVESLRVMHDDEMLPTDLWQQIEPYPPYYWVNPIPDTSRNRRLSTTIENTKDLSFKVYASSTTIVVVPDNLVDQWVREKYKHIQDTSNGLEVLKIDSSTMVIPEPHVLIKYDLVLISISRMSREYIPIDSHIRKLWNVCRCSQLGLSTCTCGKHAKNATYRSPLLRVHWKRLIVDEGHVMSTKNTTRALMATYLIAERRWVCTGTPTHNLVQATSALITDPNITESKDALADTAAQHNILTSTSNSPKKSPRSRHTAGPRDTSSDFLQLGSLVSSFLRMPPFTHSSSLWNSLIVSPCKKKQPGAHTRLQALMQSIMVRNRPETLKSEVQLPPLYEKPIYLPPTYFQSLTYNTIVAFFHINAILTEREGRDYFFHPENKKHLRQIVENLFHACFWFSITLKHINDGVNNGLHGLELWKEGKKPYTLREVEILQQSIKELQRASDNPGWAYLAQTTESPGYWSIGLPEKVSKDMFALPSQPLNTCPPPKLATATQLQDISDSAKNMLSTEPNNLPPLKTNISPEEFNKLQTSRVQSCTSNKITYLVDKLKQYSETEKCIVFATTPNQVLLLHDALCIAKIHHLLYANQVTSQRQRQHIITTFSTSTLHNTIIMDVHLAAYGIDLSAASRVWFISPIWQAARERQAIKRAHRLGQTRPVFIETLLTKGTIEEALWSRRQEISNEENEETAAKDVEEDGKIRSVLLNATFVQHSPGADIPGSDADPGKFTSDIRPWPQNLRYPPILYQKYKTWRPDAPEHASPDVPFYRTPRLILRLNDKYLGDSIPSPSSHQM